MTEEFSGKNVILTGAGGGQGLAIARALQQEGAEVTAIDLKPDYAGAHYGLGWTYYPTRKIRGCRRRIH